MTVHHTIKKTDDFRMNENKPSKILKGGAYYEIYTYSICVQSTMPLFLPKMHQQPTSNGLIW